MMGDKAGTAGNGWWQRFNDWQVARLAQATVERDDRLEWNLRLRTRRREWALLIWFALAWLLALWLPSGASTLQKLGVMALVLSPLLLLALSRLRVWRELDEMMRRVERAAWVSAGTCATAILTVHAVLDVLHLLWPVRPTDELLGVALVYGLARCIARSRYR
jgi:hypothetical protein